MWPPDKLGDAIAALNQYDAFEPLVSIGMPIHNCAATLDAAIAWTACVGADALILFAMAKRFFPCSALVSGGTTLMLVVVLFSLMSATVPRSVLVKGLFLSVAILGFGSVSWFPVLSPEERALPLGYASRGFEQ